MHRLTKSLQDPMNLRIIRIFAFFALFTYGIRILLLLEYAACFVEARLYDSTIEYSVIITVIISALLAIFFFIKELQRTVVVALVAPIAILIGIALPIPTIDYQLLKYYIKQQRYDHAIEFAKRQSRSFTILDRVSIQILFGEVNIYTVYDADAVLEIPLGDIQLDWKLRELSFLANEDNCNVTVRKLAAKVYNVIEKC